MRIVSKYRDYYDGVMGLAPDDPYVWVRNEEFHALADVDIVWPLSTELSLEFCSTNNPDVYGRYPHPFIIGFCGKFYTGMYLHDDDGSWREEERLSLPTKGSVSRKFRSDGGEYSSFESRRWFFYSPNEFHEFNKKLGRRGMKFDKKEKVPRWNRKKFSYPVWKLWKEKVEAIDPTPIHQAFKAPIFWIRRTLEDMDICTNPELIRFGFAKVLSPYQAYQKLDMFLNGVLGNTAQAMVNISDTDMRDKKGFDDRSFKTRPGSKKPRRKGR